MYGEAEATITSILNQFLAFKSRVESEMQSQTFQRTWVAWLRLLRRRSATAQSGH